MKPGEQVVISDGRDKDYYCEITELNPGEITVQVLKETEAAELPARLILYQGLPKGEKMELIIQKAVELGACGLFRGRDEALRCEAGREESESEDDSLEHHRGERGEAVPEEASVRK